MRKLSYALAAALLIFVHAHSAEAADVRTWHAQWIAPPEVAPESYGVYRFRRDFELSAPPARFTVHVSADNRYELFINGTRVVRGPARGDLFHWRYETLDLASYLKPGRNVVAALVWNWGDFAPLNQISAGTAFLLEGDDDAARINSDKQWLVARDEAYSAVPVIPRDIGWQYYVAAPGEKLDAQRFLWNWLSPAFDDSHWTHAQLVGSACASEWSLEEVHGDCHDPRLLVPRPIPLLEEKLMHFETVRLSENATATDGFAAGKAAVEIAPKTHARILLDTGRVITGYPQLRISGGAGAKVALRYAESLWIPHTNRKGNRNEIAGKEVRGVQDIFLADGGYAREWQPLWWRSFRYVEITIDTAEQPVSIADPSFYFSVYPFEKRASFESDAPEWLARVLETGWWTNRLSSHETYLDAYFEQLQYVGDTRIEALVSLYESGDARLMRNALEQIEASRTPNGLTFSRAPTRLYQYTPTFSLLWIGMLHDYWWYVNDPAFVRESMPGVRDVLGWFERLENPDGTLRSLPYYNFLDSDWKWNPHALAPFELQLVQAFAWAADLEQQFGEPALASRYRAAADRLRTAIRARYWDPAQQLFADDAAHTRFSQQTNALAVLAGLLRGDDARRLMERTLADPSLTRCTIYFAFYLNRAAIEAGLGDRYLELLKPWRDLLALGVTAWPESEDPNARSDCHGWGDHPNIEIYRAVLGIDSAAPGFARLRVEPHLGDLQRVNGAIPHPQGRVRLRLERTSRTALKVRIESPVAGDFFWHGQTRSFAPGTSAFVIGE